MSDGYLSYWRHEKKGLSMILKLRGAVRKHHEQVQTCLCVPSDAAALQQLTGCISESLSEG